MHVITIVSIVICIVIKYTTETKTKPPKCYMPHQLFTASERASAQLLPSPYNRKNTQHARGTP